MINNRIGHYCISNIIGTGSWATVVRAIDTQSHRDVAIKIISKEKIEKLRTVDLTRESIRILASIEHPNIVKYYETIEDNNNFYVITENCPGINLYEWIVSSKEVNNQKVMKIMPQIINAILYLHERRISHGDIKLENIIVNPKNLHIKLIDFGFARSVRIGEKIQNEYVTLSYCAPEIFLNKQYCPFEADIWALGVVFYCLKTKNFPFWEEGDDEEKEIEKIVNGTYEIPKTATIFDKQLLAQTLCQDPSSRADAKAVAELFKIHKFNTLAYMPKPKFFSQKVTRIKTVQGLPPLKKQSSFL